MSHLLNKDEDEEEMEKESRTEEVVDRRGEEDSHVQIYEHPNKTDVEETDREQSGDEMITMILKTALQSWHNFKLT